MASTALNVLEETKLILEWAADNYKGKLVEGEGRVQRDGPQGWHPWPSLPRLGPCPCDPAVLGSAAWPRLGMLCPRLFI